MGLLMNARPIPRSTYGLITGSDCSSSAGAMSAGDATELGIGTAWCLPLRALDGSSTRVTGTSRTPREGLLEMERPRRSQRQKQLTKGAGMA